MTTHFGKAPSLVAREIAGETILVPIKQNVSDLQYLYTLNDVGSRVWQIINERTTVEEIVSVITQEYEVEAAEAQADVLEFLAEMKNIGAVVERAEGGN